MKKIILILALLSVHVMAQNIYATFDVEAAKSANLSLTSSGIINKIDVDVGSHVKKGDVLLSLDSRDLEASLELAKVRLDLAKISAKYAKRSFERFEKVKKVIDEGEYDKYVSTYERAKASMHQAELDIKLKQTMIDKTVLKAPFDGVISDKPVEVGDVVSGAMIKTLLTIQSTDDVKLLLYVDQKYWKSLKSGSNFIYKVDGDDEVRSGNVSKIYPTANTNNRKIIVEVPAKNILPGLFGEGQIEVQ